VRCRGRRGTSAAARVFRGCRRPRPDCGRGVRPVPLNDPLQEGAQGPQPLPVGVSRQGALDTRRTGRPDFVVLDVVAADTRDAANACAADTSPAAATPQRRCVPFTDHGGGQRPQWDILQGGPSAAAGSARGPGQTACVRGPGPARVACGR
jgi:hypothetical protein